MEADIHSIELQWEHIKFAENGSPNQFAHIDALARYANSVAQKYPGEVEPLIWAGIITSEEAGMAGTMNAMGYAKRAKTLLEAAYAKIPPLSTLGHRQVSVCSIIAFRAGLSVSATTTKRASFSPRPSRSRRTEWTPTTSMRTS